ncbi:hypothetical protein [Olleya sp. R77988]|uniref:hypothetical protein n=1 Tax=Olleya sp. R77988 TaxID=3093875 RepID=UPI0037C50392
MIKIRVAFCIVFIVQFQFLKAQTVELTGSVTGEDDIENIHILNKTSLTNATTDKEGKFTINAKLNDTIVFSAVQYELLIKVVNQEDITSKTLSVTLQLFTNELDEVFLVKPLSGNLSDDVANSDAKPEINFYDVGIPGYKGKPKTQAERKLFEADHGKMFYVGLGAAVNLNKLLNKVSGRTKKLKEIVRLENDDALLARLKNDLSAIFFESNPLDEKHRTEFFYFVQEDENFRSTCSKSNLDTLTFLKLKLDQFNKNLVEKE